MSESARQMLDDIFAPEELHPDLKPYVRESPSLGQVLHHKLIVSVPYWEATNKHINGIYKHKLETLERAVAEEDWATYVFVHERPYRFDAFMEVIARADLWDGDRTPEKARLYWELAGNIWTDSENIHEYLDEWTEVWRMGDEQERLHLMDEDELAVLNGLPGEIQVWRGTNHPDGTKGLSWTIDKDKAFWFARRWSNDDRIPKVTTGMVYKSDVLAYFGGRGESELVILPENVRVTNTRRIPLKRKQ